MPATASTETYLQRQLEDKRRKLDYLSEQHRIDIAVFNAKKEMLNSDIDYLEGCLKSVKS